MSKKLKLTKIGLETKSGKKVELSIEEAKELHDQLHELFGDKYQPSYPIYIERYRHWPYEYPHGPVWSTTNVIGSVGTDTQLKVTGSTGLNVTYNGNLAGL